MTGHNRHLVIPGSPPGVADQVMLFPVSLNPQTWRRCVQVPALQRQDLLRKDLSSGRHQELSSVVPSAPTTSGAAVIEELRTEWCRCGGVGLGVERVMWATRESEIDRESR